MKILHTSDWHLGASDNNLSLWDIQKITESLDNILNNDDKLEAALDMFCYIARLQAFNDGNKKGPLH